MKKNLRLALTAVAIVAAVGGLAFGGKTAYQEWNERQLAKALASTMDENGRLKLDTGQDFGEFGPLMSVVGEYNQRSGALLAAYQKEPFLAAMRQAVDLKTLADKTAREKVAQSLKNAPEVVSRYNTQYATLMDQFGADLKTKAGKQLEKTGGWAEAQKGLDQNKLFFGTFFELERQATETMTSIITLLDKAPHKLEENKFVFTKPEDDKAMTERLKHLMQIATHQTMLMQRQQAYSDTHMDVLKDKAGL